MQYGGYMETLSTNTIKQDIRQITSLDEIADRLLTMTQIVQQRGGVDRSTYNTINSISTEVIDDTYPIESFTRSMSTVNYNVTVESLTSAVGEFTRQLWAALVKAWKRLITWMRELYARIAEMFTDRTRQVKMGDEVKRTTQSMIEALPPTERQLAKTRLEEAKADVDNVAAFNNAHVYFRNHFTLSTIRKDAFYQAYEQAYDIMDQYIDTLHERMLKVEQGLQLYVEGKDFPRAVARFDEARFLTTPALSAFGQKVRQVTQADQRESVSIGAHLIALFQKAQVYKADIHVDPALIGVQDVLESKVLNIQSLSDVTKQKIKDIESYIAAQDNALDHIRVERHDVNIALRAAIRVIRDDIDGLHSFKELQYMYVRLSNNGGKLHNQFWRYLFTTVCKSVKRDTALDVVNDYTDALNKRIALM
jgi:hypothetical protein